MKSFKLSIIALLIGGIGFVSCSKENENGVDANGNPLFAKPGSATTKGNGQGIMVDMNIQSGATYTISGEEVYTFNETTAATYFNISTPSVTYDCGGSAANCDASNKPAQPAAPSTSADDLKTIIQNNRCLLRRGGDLTGGSIVKTVSVAGLNGKGNWTFTYTYDVTPTQTSVNELTAWDLVSSSSNEGLSIPIEAKIAGLSYTLHNSGDKYSFSLTEMVNGVETSRVQDVKVYVNDVLVGEPANTVINASSTEFEEFTWATTLANMYGNTAKISAVNGVNARTILNSDGFSGNNDGGSDGKALAYAKMNTVNFTPSTDNNYTIRITGTIKGNGVDVTTGFSVAKTITVVTPQCNGGGQE